MITDTSYTVKCTTLQKFVKSETEAFHKRLKRLYPCVDDVSKLPSAWSHQDRASPLGLTNDSLGCYFRGRKLEEEKSAAAVRANHNIPPSCLLYYFEITFISKGQEGYLGIGLTKDKPSWDRFPGWERDSYGYHADDGNIFDGNSRGHQFGPTSTTGDIIGCGYNLVEGKIFFTKNGINLGKAFDDVPSNILYFPMIGLKQAGEEISANFGQKEFAYDIEQDLRSLRKNMTITISNHPIPDFGSWQSTLHRLVQSWLVQNSYPETAEAFTRSAKMECKENMQRVRQRNQIQQLVLSGKISEAIRLTNLICPNMLQNNPNLLFALKCRQFIELISGAESDFQPIFNYDSESKSSSSSNILNNNNANGNNLRIDANGDQMSPPPPPPPSSHSNNSRETVTNAPAATTTTNNNGCNGMIGDNNCEKVDDQHSTSSSYQDLMDVDQPAPLSNNNTSSNYTINNNNNNHQNHRTSSNEMTTGNSARPLNQINDRASTNNHEQRIIINGATNDCHLGGYNAAASMNIPLGDPDLDCNEQKYAKLIQFGQELSDYLNHLNKTFGRDDANERMLQDAISLIAYIDPSSNPRVGKQLDPSEREPISQMLNRSILNTELTDQSRPPLDDVMNHLKSLVRLNNSHGRWLVDQLY